jgi:hypothetical protein
MAEPAGFTDLCKLARQTYLSQPEAVRTVAQRLQQTMRYTLPGLPDETIGRVMVAAGMNLVGHNGPQEEPAAKAVLHALVLVGGAFLEGVPLD